MCNFSGVWELDHFQDLDLEWQFSRFTLFRVTLCNDIPYKGDYSCNTSKPPCLPFHPSAASLIFNSTYRTYLFLPIEYKDQLRTHDPHTLRESQMRGRKYITHISIYTFRLFCDARSITPPSYFSTSFFNIYFGGVQCVE